MAEPPRDVILEPNERILIATRPLFVWEPLVLLEAILVIAALYLYGRSSAGTPSDTSSAQLQWLSYGCLAFALVLLCWMLLRWIPWSRKWYVLTDRRVIARWGVLDRNQAALFLDRIQDVSLTRPFLLSLVRDYGVVHLESAGKNAEERISGGLDELDMTEATEFYRALTDAQSKT